MIDAEVDVDLRVKAMFALSAVSRNSKAIGEELLKMGGGGDLLTSLLTTPGRHSTIISSH